MIADEPGPFGPGSLLNKFIYLLSETPKLPTTQKGSKWKPDQPPDFHSKFIEQ
jgi:hypothetical protein